MGEACSEVGANLESNPILCDFDLFCFGFFLPPSIPSDATLAHAASPRSQQPSCLGRLDLPCNTLWALSARKLPLPQP